MVHLPPRTLPNSHGIAYTTRGLLESGAILGEDRYTEAALRTAHALSGIYRKLGRLPATYDRDWTPRARYVCVTGLAQNGGVWLRLYQETGDEMLRQAGPRGRRAGSRTAVSGQLARDGRGSARLLPALRTLCAAPVPELGCEVPRRLLALRLRVIGNGR